MTLTHEMIELVRFLSKRDDYVIFAGFGAFLHTSIESSSDIDIFVPTPKTVEEISKLLATKGWKQVKKETDNKYYSVSCLKKKKTSLDVVYSVTSKKSFYPTKERIKFQKYTLNVLSREAMLITKINQLTQLNRLKTKYERDRKVIDSLRKKINIKKLRKLLKNLHELFWTFGRL